MENIGAIYYDILTAIIAFCIFVVIAFVLAKKFPFLANICLLCHAMLLLPFATILSKMFSPLSFEDSISMTFLLIFFVIIPQTVFFIYTKINKDIKRIDIILVLAFLGILTWSFINPSPTVIENNKTEQTAEAFSEQSNSVTTEEILIANGAKE